MTTIRPVSRTHVVCLSLVLSVHTAFSASLLAVTRFPPALTSLRQAALVIPIHSVDRTANACIRTLQYTEYTQTFRDDDGREAGKVFRLVVLRNPLVLDGTSTPLPCPCGRLYCFPRFSPCSPLIQWRTCASAVSFRACVAHRSLCSIGHVQVCRELGVAVSLCVRGVVRVRFFCVFGGCS